MNEEMVRRHNERVGPDDIVWHLGDFAMDEYVVERTLPRLNGKHYLVAGNHDKCYPTRSRAARARTHYMRQGFVEIHERACLQDGKFKVLACHLPLRGKDTTDLRYVEQRPTEADLSDAVALIHGHVHEKWKTRRNMVNVGVDVWDFAPVSETELEAAIEGVLASV